MTSKKSLRIIQFAYLKILFLFIFLIGFSDHTIAQEQRITNPKKARLITTDIDNFWQMFDRLPEAKSEQDTLAILKKYYLDKASKGLNDYFQREKKNNNENIEQRYLEVLRKYPKYLTSIRVNTKQIEKLKPVIIQRFVDQKKLYPAFQFPDTYFTIGYFNSGGTSLNNGLFIGMEINCALDNANFQEWGESSWLQNLNFSLDDLINMVTHEAVHAQQPWVKLDLDLNKTSLLSHAIIEGGAAFVTDLVNKPEIRPVDSNKRAYEYGKNNEKEVWEAFKQDMLTTNWEKWLYSQATEDFPKDMGYIVGYKICESYYDNAKDKKQAIKDIIEVTDFENFLMKSKYEEKFKI
jgi:hypothetical protein